MPDEPIDRILDAAYACFTRHGVRRTTMDDIAAAAGMSRPAVYQYVRNKDDAFRRLATRLFDEVLDKARAAAESDAPLAERLYNVVAAKLDLAVKLWRDTPHAAELLDAGARLSGDLADTLSTAIRELVATTIAKAEGELDLAGTDPAEIADVVLALTYGLESDLTDPRRTRRRLRLGITLLLAGLSVTPSRGG
ncbi:MAG TPA: TetR/AcrR family transcriptional regulator [Actinophytocola sp.]|uniref:TetR/AcrR family transcriptional regulator n=1 Tax=Actinophytocola sp. TaxID=1872138 RepID=UPI002DDD44BF|nr:TetR/AcrR family transcriptional regulator [Actinophytocola sp.]HEV2782570.1 TetR/AcrR family transcriptional regulator [Actinophytocola sp.]